MQKPQITNFLLENLSLNVCFLSILGRFVLKNGYEQKPPLYCRIPFVHRGCLHFFLLIKYELPHFSPKVGKFCSKTEHFSPLLAGFPFAGAFPPQIVARKGERGAEESCEELDDAHRPSAPSARVYGVNPTADALSALGIGIELGLGDVMSGGIEAVAIGSTDIAPFAERHAAAFFAHFHGIGCGVFLTKLVGGGLPCGISACVGAGIFDDLGRGFGLGAVFGATVMAFAAFLLTATVTAFVLRRFGTQYFIETLLIPIERPRQPGAGHGKQQHKEVGAADSVEVKPAAMASAAKVDGELFAQAARGARPESHETRDQHEQKHERAHAHDEFTPPDAFALVGEVEQPAVEFEHHFEEGEMFLWAGDATCVGIDEPLGERRRREVEFVVARAVIGNAHARYGDTRLKMRLDTLHQFRERQATLRRHLGFIAIVVGPFRNFACKFDHGTRETDERDDQTEGNSEPKVETFERFFHV